MEKYNKTEISLKWDLVLKSVKAELFIEHVIDHGCRELGFDPIMTRRLNLARPGQQRYSNILFFNYHLIIKIKTQVHYAFRLFASQINRHLISVCSNPSLVQKKKLLVV